MYDLLAPYIVYVTDCAGVANVPEFPSNILGDGFNGLPINGYTVPRSKLPL